MKWLLCPKLNNLVSIYLTQQWTLTTLINSFIQSNAEAMPTLSEESPLDYDKLHSQGGEEVGLEPAVEMDRRRTPGASTGEMIEMTAVLEQESKVYRQLMYINEGAYL